MVVKITKAEKLIEKISIVFVFCVLVSCRYTKVTDFTIKYKIEDMLEVGNNLASFNDSIFYTKNINGIYQLLKSDYANNKPVVLTTGQKDVDYPFVFGKHIYYLCGNQLSDRDSNVPISVHGIYEMEYSAAVGSESGKYAYLKQKNVDSIIIIALGQNFSQKFAIPIGQINGVCFSEENKLLILSVGDQVLKIDIQNNRVEEILKVIPGPKFNPFIYEEKIYFSCFGNTDKMQIFSWNMLSPSNAPIHEISTDSDLRLARRDKKYLFFVEISHSEYLLKCKDLGSGEVFNVTDKGVVYNYVMSNGRIVFIFSDQGIPKGLKEKSITSKTLTDLDCKSFTSCVTFELLEKNGGGASTYKVSAVSGEAVKGVILYFHPGKINGDFSPRWDNMIYPLVMNNYVLVAPNFPGSVGFGKKYSELGADSSIKYMNDWLDKLRKLYPGLPIYLYGLSSGCPLMEICILSRPDIIAGAISAFGLTSNQELPANVPLLYILGKEDNIVLFGPRHKTLVEQSKNHDKQDLLILEKAGHWIQYPDEYNLYFQHVLKFMEDNR